MSTRTISIIILVVVFAAIAIHLTVPKHVDADGVIKLGKPKMPEIEPSEAEVK